jgi:hypothetical protein
MIGQSEPSTLSAIPMIYLVERRLEISRATADKKMAEAELARLGETREQILLNARTREAEQAQSQAAARAQEAEQAKTQTRQLAQELADLKAKQTERGLVLNFLFTPLIMSYPMLSCGYDMPA